MGKFASLCSANHRFASNIAISILNNIKEPINSKNIELVKQIIYEEMEVTPMFLMKIENIDKETIMNVLNKFINVCTIKTIKKFSP